MQRRASRTRSRAIGLPVLLATIIIAFSAIAISHVAPDSHAQQQVPTVTSVTSAAIGVTSSVCEEGAMCAPAIGAYGVGSSIHIYVIFSGGW